MRVPVTTAKFVILLVLGLLILPLYGLWRGVFWLTWSFLVLLGKVKAGPSETWNDDVARHDFNARRIEVKLAAHIFITIVSGVVGAVCYVVSLSMDKMPTTSWEWVLTFSTFGPLLVLFYGAMYLSTGDGLAWRDWRVLDRRLERRTQQPVLF